MSAWRQFELEISLVYTVSSQAARATETVSENKQNKRKQNNNNKKKNPKVVCITGRQI